MKLKSLNELKRKLDNGWKKRLVRLKIGQQKPRKLKNRN